MKAQLTLAALCAVLIFSAPALANEKSMTDMATMMFNKMDTNNDGKVTKAEHDAFGTKKFDDADTDNDDTLSLSEMQAHMVKEKSGHKMDKDTGGEKDAGKE